jgi:hypothetical protein
MNKEIALGAAKPEAFIADDANENESQRGIKQRRKWDCFHVATAQFYRCSELYTADAGMLNRGQQLAINDIEFSKPEPRSPQLALKGTALHLKP